MRLPVATSVVVTPKLLPLHAPGAPVAVSAIVNTPRSAPGDCAHDTSMYEVVQEGMSESSAEREEARVVRGRGVVGDRQLALCDVADGDRVAGEGRRHVDDRLGLRGRGTSAVAIQPATTTTT